MANKCVFCGRELENGVCPNAEQHFKPMCLNCTFCQNNSENPICINEENKQDAVNKIKASYEGGYAITDISLSPLPLKDPSKKCKRYNLNTEAIIEQLTKKH